MNKSNPRDPFLDECHYCKEQYYSGRIDWICDFHGRMNGRDYLVETLFVKPYDPQDLTIYPMIWYWRMVKQKPSKGKIPRRRFLHEIEG